MIGSYAWRELLAIRGPLVREVILEFYSTLRFREGLYTTEEMETDGFGAYWADNLRVIASRLSWQIIGLGFLLVDCIYHPGRGQALDKVTTTDLFYLRSIDKGTAVNVC
ncbi:hypothetical protein Tco_1337553 [Tanacetum coccineum]